MIKKYPLYTQGDLEAVFSKLPKKDQTIINEFVAYCGIGAALRKQGDIKRSIIQFRHVVEKPFDSITLNDLRSYLSLLNQSGRAKYTTNGIKTHIKRFLRWKFKEWSERFDNLKDVRLVSDPFNHERINEGTLLKKEEIETIMQKEHDLTKKTFFITMYESGCRPQEIRECRWKDVEFNTEGEISDIHVYSKKTGQARTVYVKNATRWLKQLKEHKPSELLFPSREDKNKATSKATCIRWIRDLGKHINRDIFPYLLRHTRANELYISIPEKVAQKSLGHKKNMSDLYSKISSKDVKQAMRSIIYNMELSPQEENQLKREIEVLKQEQLRNNKLVAELYSILKGVKAEGVPEGIKVYRPKTSEKKNI